jgi:hypothetical protein
MQRVLLLFSGFPLPKQRVPLLLLQALKII